MVDLQVICGLPLRLTDKRGTVLYEDSITFEKKDIISIGEIVPVLLNRSLRYPEKVYHHYYQVSHVDDTPLTSESVSYDVIEIPYGLLGIEFVKTHIYYGEESVGDTDSIVEVISGELSIILQYTEEDETSGFETVSNIEIISLSEGERIAIPTGVYYTFVNTGSNTLVFARVAAKNNKPIDYYKYLAKERGLGCFIISKNARIEIVNNPKYKTKPDMYQNKWAEMPDEEKIEYAHSLIEDDTPLYNIFRNSTKDVEVALAV